MFQMERVVGIHFYNENASNTIQGYTVPMKNGLYYKEIQDLIAISPFYTEVRNKVIPIIQA